MRDSSTTRVAAKPPEIEPGSTLGAYELVSLIGKGAMGRVFRARHVLLGREVAIKVLNPEYVARPDVVERFFREARVVNDIDHEHIVEVTDFVEAPGLAYLVMELLDGSSLRALTKHAGRRYPPIRRAVGILAQVCDALQAAHDKGVVHRDLKPDNVVVAERGGGDFVKVLDFGVAKLRDSVGDQETSAGVILGTPLYMSPEQALGKEIDRRADVWSAGVVLYELLSGTVPFTAPSFVELAIQLREQPPRPLPRKTPRGERIPAWVTAIVMRCLEKRPEDRFRSMAALAEALRAPRRRRRGGAASRLVAAAVAIALLAAGGAVAVQRGLDRRVLGALEPAWRSLRALASRVAVPDATTAPGPAPAAPAGASATRTQSASHAAPAKAQETRRTSAGAARARTVELFLRSTPTGATVLRQDTGERLGRTPLRVDVARKAASVWLKMSLDGYEPVRFTVDLRRDNTANVTFKGAKKPARRR